MISGGVFASLLLTDPLLRAQRGRSIYRVASYDFYDLQAHSLLSFRWDVPPTSLGLEAFVLHGKTYEYFGPLPAVFRLPIAAITNRFDGRLGQLSMLAAFAVLMTFTARLARRIRPLVRRDSPVTRSEQWAVGVFIFFVGAGTVIVFLASRAYVYHEAAIWGVALAVAAFDFVLAFARAPTARNLLLASFFTTLAFQARAASGLGPFLALAILVVAMALPRTRRLAGLGERSMTWSFGALAAGTLVVPLALYCAVNYAKFGMPFSLPWEAQLSMQRPIRRAFLATHGGSMLSARFLPTTLCHFLRPEAVIPSSWFPFWKFNPSSGPCDPMTLGSPTSSVPVSMPAFAILAVAGTIGAIRGRRRNPPELAVLRAPLLGACVGLLPTLAFGYMANRYLADFLPGILLASLAGLHLVLRWSGAQAHRRATKLVWVGLALLMGLGAWSNLATAILYARSLEGHTPPYTRRSFHEFQRSVRDLYASDTNIAPKKVLLVVDSMTKSSTDEVASDDPHDTIIGAGINTSGLLDWDNCNGQQATLLAKQKPDVWRTCNQLVNWKT